MLHQLTKFRIRAGGDFWRHSEEELRLTAVPLYQNFIAVVDDQPWLVGFKPSLGGKPPGIQIMQEFIFNHLRTRGIRLLRAWTTTKPDVSLSS